jgi:hypothetical protein
MPASGWQSKARANADYHDLNPIITYRHLYSHNLGVKDPLRVIALCDSDAFYAACERERLGLSDSAPIVVQQWDSLIAVSYPARPCVCLPSEVYAHIQRQCIAASAYRGWTRFGMRRRSVRTWSLFMLQLLRRGKWIVVHRVSTLKPM